MLFGREKKRGMPMRERRFNTKKTINATHLWVNIDAHISILLGGDWERKYPEIQVHTDYAGKNQNYQVFILLRGIYFLRHF
jgi:hypothetical protein